jgi:hypothetical protein
VIDGTTGVLFSESTVQSLIEGLERASSIRFDPDAIRVNAERFSPPVFRAKFADLLNRTGVDRSLYSTNHYS